MTNLKILDHLSEGSSYFSEIKQSFPGLDFISPVISVMTKHIYSTSSVLNVINLVGKIGEKHEEPLQDKIEKEIIDLGLKLLRNWLI